MELPDAAGNLLREYGGYDGDTAELDEASTVVYELVNGWSPAAAAVTGYPAGSTLHTSLADTIVEDARISPRGFSDAAFEAGGAAVVGRNYADGQFWDAPRFRIPLGAVGAQVRGKLPDRHAPPAGAGAESSGLAAGARRTSVAGVTSPATRAQTSDLRKSMQGKA